MKKKIFIFFLFIVLPVSAFADLTPYCNNTINNVSTNNIQNLKINKITVNVNNYRKWSKNSLKILIGNFRWIPKKFKKRFKANITVHYENNLICSFKGKIRNNGNQKDHIALKGNSITQSIDVHLNTGNIYGITKFKLLRPNTRGKFKDEMLLTELLREFNYLAPRTNYIDTEINEINSKMLFQEKPSIELLKFNSRKDGPIFEGDERFMFSLVDKMPDNQLSNEALGMLPLLEKGINSMLARQVNSEWAMKNENNYKISNNSLSNLNLAYILYVNKYKNEKNNFQYNEYNLDNNLLGLGNPNNILKLDIYNLLVLSANGWHGLAPNNRKFYWNEIENFFEPINSDTNANISIDTNSFHLPVSKKIDLAFNDLKNLLDEVDVDLIHKNISFRGLDISKKETKDKINKIKANLNSIKVLYMDKDPLIVKYNRENKISLKMLYNYYSSLHAINPNIFLVKQSSNDNSFERCNVKTLNCEKYSFNKKQLTDLIEGRLVINNNEYQYLGNKINEIK